MFLLDHPSHFELLVAVAHLLFKRDDPVQENFSTIGELLTICRNAIPAESTDPATLSPLQRLVFENKDLLEELEALLEDQNFSELQPYVAVAKASPEEQPQTIDRMWALRLLAERFVSPNSSGQVT
jgi:hypothetical protein